MHEAHDVVLVLGEGLHTAKRVLVLQRTVEQASSELVPPVGAHVVLCIQLGKDPVLLVARQGDQQRTGTP